MSNYNVLVLKILSVTDNVIKYKRLVDILNDTDKIHSYIIQKNNDFNYKTLNVGNTYIITCLIEDSIWTWIKAVDVEEIINK